MKKRSLLTSILLFVIAVFVFSITACNPGGSTTLESLRNDYGIVVDGGGFQEGSTLVSNEVALTTEEAETVLTVIADQNYNKNGSVYIFDIYVTKEGVKVQPNGKVTVTIPAPNAQISNYLVFHIKANNSVENLVPTVANGKISFETSSFSYFVIAETVPEHVHEFGDWTANDTVEDKHIRRCNCGEYETGDCEFDDGEITQNPTHVKEGVRTYTCADCGRTKEEPVPKTTEHSFGNWTVDETTENKHYRQCNCGEKETGDCEFDDGEITEPPTHFEEGVKTYTCTICDRTKDEPVDKTPEHNFGDWAPDRENENKHVRECKCGEIETDDCNFDDGEITQNPTHVKEGVRTYTCADCGRTKEEPVPKTTEHSFGNWTVDETTENKHYRQCNCGEVETGDCDFDDGEITEPPTHTEEGVKTYTCTICDRTKDEPVDKTPEHNFGDWAPDHENKNKHVRECKCGEVETDDCDFDDGEITQNPTHFEEGVRTYTCADCGRTKEEPVPKTTEHSFGNWIEDETTENKHYRQCNCGEKETGDCDFDDGEITKDPTHTEEGVRTYTCTVCGATKDEPVDKTPEHNFGDWAPDRENDNKHVRECKCGEVETDNCNFDDGEITKEPTHTEEGVRTYTCADCGRTKDEPIDKTPEHEFGDWTPDRENENKHVRECKCGEKETDDCDFDDGEITEEPTHTEEGVKTYTCTVCDRTKDEPIDKTPEHEFGDWTPDEVIEDEHYRECECGEMETGDCDFEDGICKVCGREKHEEGIIIVIAGGTATFKGKETATTYSNIYGENANVYIAQENDVLSVTLTDQEGRTFKRWVSASGTIIPDEDFSMLVFTSGYYYPEFEDTDDNDFSNRELIFEGNCEEGNLYMSTNSKGDIKYELEFVNFGHHNFDEMVDYNSQYHKQECLFCGENLFEEHTDHEYEVEKEPSHTEEGLMRCKCYCGHVWTEPIPTTDEHSIDYDDWHIVEESKNGQYGKYRVYCKYCDYYEEYWYLGGLDFIGFMDNAMINYQYTYGGKVCHNEFYYSYTNAENQKVYIWAFQYEYETSSNKDNNDTFIFMYVDDEDSTTIEPIYLSKSRGDKRSEFLWAIYGYAYDVNGWIETLDYPDDNMGCGNGMVLGNSMSARASVFESYHDYWAETYNDLRIPTSKAYDDLSGTPWQIEYEGKSFQGGYYDENDDYVMTGGRDTICFVKNAGTSYKKHMYVDKATGITYGYADYGTYFRTVFLMNTYKTIVSHEEFEKLDEAGKSVHYSYGNIENDIKSLCSRRNIFSNFTLTVPETINAFRFIFSDPVDCVELIGADVNVYSNTAHVYDSGKPITLSWQDEEGIVFDRYEIWDFANQEWVLLSESKEFTFNTSDNPVRDAVYARVICHEVEVPDEPSETFRITVENGYFEIDGKEYTGTVEVAVNTQVYVYANYVEGKTFEYWLDGNDQVFDKWRFYVTCDITLTPVYTDAIYCVNCQGWDYESLISVNGGEMHYSNEFEGKIGDTVELNTIYDPDGECTVFIGWYLETYGKNGSEYILISDSQSFTYTITGEETGWLYSVWTTGENPMIKKYVDIRVTNGFVNSAGGEGGDMYGVRDNAYSAISVCAEVRIVFYDDPTDETVYTIWDVTYRYELEGEVEHEISESYEDEYDFYPADFWVNNPEYSYPDGEINVTGVTEYNEDLEE